MKKYDHTKIEKKWQKKWAKDKLYETADKVHGKENFYTLFEFPYPSGNLHIGHWYAFAVPDIFARMKRTQGYNVLFPIGFDAFGLPAENAAIKRGLDPRKWTYENIEYMEGQFQNMGGSFDWSRKIVTSDPEYYKWTQWLFLQFFKKNLAYKKKALVNWCPKDQTVLANEQVVDGKCERCGTEVEQKNLEQWFFKITDYAERLLFDLEELDWPEPIKDSQRNWIGRSEGAEIEFGISNSEYGIKVFTTRADTLFGATYIVLAPEHKMIQDLKSKIENWNEVIRYIEETKSKTEIERTNVKKEKTGIELNGVKAINPATKEEISIWVADYVLADYGTGAVMSVPAHDERDFEFAKKYNLPVKHVVIPRRIDHKNPHVANKKVVFRNAIIAIIRNPKDGKYLTLKWKKQPWTTFVMGGMEEGEDPVDAAKREILEETGYKNLKFIKNLGGPTQSEFYAAHKGENRIAHSQSMLFELESEERNEISAEESEIHELVWVSPDQITADNLTHIEMDLVLERMKNGVKAYTSEGITINSGDYSMMPSEKAREKIAEKFGKKVVKYKLRDWLLSRQRYWGCPIPVVYDTEGKPHPISEKHLPWELPRDKIDLTPKGKSPLESSKEFQKRTEKIFGKGWRPEYDTMDTFVDSSWYFLRYADPKNKKKPFDREKLKNWLPVKMYSGGAEHTTMHLLYSRFFHKALFDMGLVNESEPYLKRMNRGLILGADGQKMSKSKGNVVDPDEQVGRVGADTVRMYLGFIGPYNEVGQYPWDLGGIAGIRRFLEKIWKYVHGWQKEYEKLGEQATAFDLGVEKNDKETDIKLNKMIAQVTNDIEKFKFNTAISTLMIFMNHMQSEPQHIPWEGMGTATLTTGRMVSKPQLEKLLCILAPFAPHMAEELWHVLRNKKSIHLEKWPKYDENKIKDGEVNIAIQVNGKVRGVIQTSSGQTESEVKNAALNMPEIKKWIEGKEIKKVIFVPDKVLNLII